MGDVANPAGADPATVPRTGCTAARNGNRPMHIDSLLALAAARGASDLHLSAGLPPLLRIDGELTRLEQPALAAEPLGAALAEFRARHADGAGGVDAGGARFRAHVFRHHRGPGAAFRLVPAQVPTLDDLGMGAVFRAMARAAHGLVLVAGATGSGKSTTLAALVDHINATRAAHILTIEDPIEFIHAPRRCLVSQRQAGRHARSFATALRSALREDPDVILIGEMRDPETIRLALTAAETGHLVLATLHAPSAPNAIDRIIDAFAGDERNAVRAMLSQSLHAIVAQILLRRVGGGRVAAREILLATPAVRNLIRERKIAQLYSAMQTGAAAGMRTLEASLRELAAEGVVRDEDAQANMRFADARASDCRQGDSRIMPIR